MLACVAQKFPGVSVENKGVGYAVHFRLAAAAVAAAAQAWVEELVGHLGPDFTLIRTSTALDIVPRQVEGKGVALRAFIATMPQAVLPIYIGDDVTDEPAFLELASGITIRVGNTPRSTYARYYLNDPAQVGAFLERFERELP